MKITSIGGTSFYGAQHKPMNKEKKQEVKVEEKKATKKRTTKKKA